MANETFSFSQVSSSINLAMQSTNSISNNTEEPLKTQKSKTISSQNRTGVVASKQTSFQRKPVAGISKSNLLSSVPKSTEVHISRLALTTSTEDIVKFLEGQVPILLKKEREHEPVIK
ncbi:hypothetical protein HHI36_004717, partial [Cryptolaemus montrouzieri]